MFNSLRVLHRSSCRIGPRRVRQLKVAIRLLPEHENKDGAVLVEVVLHLSGPLSLGREKPVGRLSDRGSSLEREFRGFGTTCFRSADKGAAFRTF